MRILAVAILILWAVYSLWFYAWKEGVAYPPKPAGLAVVSAAIELCILALASWVIAS